MEPIDHVTEDKLLKDYEESPYCIEPSKKPRDCSSRNKVRPSGKNQSRNRQIDQTHRGNRSRKRRRSEMLEPEDLIE